MRLRWGLRQHVTTVPISDFLRWRATVPLEPGPHGLSVLTLSLALLSGSPLSLHSLWFVPRCSPVRRCPKPQGCYVLSKLTRDHIANLGSTFRTLSVCSKTSASYVSLELTSQFIDICIWIS